MNLWMTVVILAFGLTATSCTEYIVNTEDNPVTPTVPTTPLTFQEQLEAIDGISDITVEKTKNGTDAYHFFVDQLIDHNNPGKGTFKQRVAMTYKGAGHTTVLYTEGYMMGSNGKNIRWTDLYDQYDANTIEVEHRYFGESLPEPIENVNYTYLNCEQAAEDLHHVVALIKKNKVCTGKWMATGVSKSGINTALYAYFSEKKGYDDIDVYVPFCAPFLLEIDSKNIGTYIITEAGKSTGIHDKINAIPQKMLQQPMRDKLIELVWEKDGKMLELTKYIVLRAMLGPDAEIDEADVMPLLHKSIIITRIYNYYNNLFGKLAYVPASKLKDYIPDPETADAATLDWFTNATYEDINKMMTEKAGTRAEYTDEELVEQRKEDPNFPYYIQTYRELGNYQFDFSAIAGNGYITEQDIINTYSKTNNKVNLARFVKQFSNQTTKDFLDNFLPKTSKKMVFVYCENDPWTGGAIPDSDNPNVVKFVSPGGGHSEDILDEDYFPKEWREKILGQINAFLGI